MAEHVALKNAKLSLQQATASPVKAGMPKVTIDAAHLQWLIEQAEKSIPTLASEKEMEKIAKELGLQLSFGSERPGILNTTTGEHKELASAFPELSMLDEINELRSLSLWAIRRLRQAHKGFAYDEYEKITGESVERE